MRFDGGQGHFVPVKDSRGQAGLYVCLLEQILEVLSRTGAGASDDGNGDVSSDELDKSQIESRLGAVLVYRVQQDFTGP
jgi:hypothetical protein